jgi:alkylhydroperoxidase family enzyme
VIADPRAIAQRWPDARLRMLAELAITLSEAPWTISPATRDRAHAAGLDDDTLLHAVMLGAYFTHLNRIADAVAVPLDYTVRQQPPVAEPAIPAFAPAPLDLPSPALDHTPPLVLSRRPATATALDGWVEYVMEKPAPLDPRVRWVIAYRVARLLGDPGIPAEQPASPLDYAVVALADQVTLAPWQLGPASYAALRGHGFDDAALFDVVATASTAGVHSRIMVALHGFAR